MLASSVGHAEVIQMLLRGGADIAIRDRNGWTAMVAAAIRSARNERDCDPIQFLIVTGAKVSARDHDGKIALPIVLTQNKALPKG